jgi:hypothetical protein
MKTDPLRLMSSNARSASQTTYALCDTPTQIRITNPIHPLRERTLDVIYSRRQGRETHWVVRLPDGSCAQIPSAWTDHPRGVVSIERLRTGGRATPESLRSLIQLLTSLFSPSPKLAAQPCMASTGDQHEQATASVRCPARGMGAGAMGSHPFGETPRDPHRSSQHGQSLTDTDCRQSQGD